MTFNFVARPSFSIDLDKFVVTDVPLIAEEHRKDLTNVFALFRLNQLFIGALVSKGEGNVGVGQGDCANAQPDVFHV